MLLGPIVPLIVYYKQVRPLLRGAPRPAYGRPRCAMFRTHRLIHHLSLSVINYLLILITASHHWQELEHNLLSRLERVTEACLRIFTFTGSQGKVHPGARACGFRFRHKRTHTRTQPTVSIDVCGFMGQIWPAALGV